MLKRKNYVGGIELEKRNGMLGTGRFEFGCLVTFKIIYTGIAFTYFYLNPGEKYLMLGIFGYFLIIPSFLFSLVVLFIFHCLKKISLSGVDRKTLMITALGASLLIFPLLPGAALLSYLVLGGSPFIILLYPAIIFCFVWYYRLASRFLDKQRF